MKCSSIIILSGWEVSFAAFFLSPLLFCIEISMKYCFLFANLRWLTSFLCCFCYRKRPLRMQVNLWSWALVLQRCWRVQGRRGQRRSLEVQLGSLWMYYARLWIKTKLLLIENGFQRYAHHRWRLDVKVCCWSCIVHCSSSAFNFPAAAAAARANNK